MEPNQDVDKLEELKKRLYSNSGNDPIIDTTRGAHLEADRAGKDVNEWGETKLPERGTYKTPYVPKSTKFFKTLFNLSVAFCLIAAGIAVFMFFSNYNRISANNIDITIVGPVSIAGGEKLSLAVSLANNNRVDLVSTHMRIDYTDGAYSATDTAKQILRDERDLETVKASSQKQVLFESVLFGEENVTRNFTVTVDYKVPGSDTVYTKEKQYTILLTKAPISLLIDSDKTVTSGQDVTFTLSAISNSTAPLQNVTLRATYPIGFSFGSSDFPPLQNTNNIWQLGNFKPGEKKSLTLHGTLVGQDGDQKIFRFSMGSPDAQDEHILATTFVDSLATLTLEKPFVVATLNLGKENKDGDVIANLGSDFEGILDIDNNLPRDLVDVAVQIVPHGQIYDRYSIQTSDGYYKSLENMLVWDKTIKNDLKIIGPGQTNSVHFKFKTFSLDKLPQLVKDAQISVDVLVTGKTLTENEGTKDVKVAFTKKIKFATQPSVTGHTLYATGAYKNTGPVPPHAEQTTTYTLQFDLKNTSSHVSGAVLTAKLPFYVDWVPRATSTENITYNSQTRVVTWNIGELTAYTGYSGAARVVAFQVQVTPSTSQIRSILDLATNITLTGTDRFTGNAIQLSVPSLTTELLDEKIDGKVVQ